MICSTIKRAIIVLISLLIIKYFILFICFINRLIFFVIGLPPFICLKVLLSFKFIYIHRTCINMHWTWLDISKWFYVEYQYIEPVFLFLKEAICISCQKAILLRIPCYHLVKKNKKTAMVLEFKSSFLWNNRLIICVFKILANVCELSVAQLGQVHSTFLCEFPHFPWNEIFNAV